MWPEPSKKFFVYCFLDKSLGNGKEKFVVWDLNLPSQYAEDDYIPKVIYFMGSLNLSESLSFVGDITEQCQPSKLYHTVG